jgi:hypothetical protein
MIFYGVGPSKNYADKAPFGKGGEGDLKETMQRYNKNLKEHSGSLRVNMTEAENLLW